MTPIISRIRAVLAQGGCQPEGRRKMQDLASGPIKFDFAAAP